MSRTKYSFTVVEEIPSTQKGTGIRYKKSASTEFIEEFLESGAGMAEVVADSGAKALSMALTFRRVISRNDLGAKLKVYVRGDKLYIENIQVTKNLKHGKPVF